MSKNIKTSLFDKIAKYYGLFFYYQKKKYNDILEIICEELDLFQYKDVVDLGCGTGALCSELLRRGFRVTGVDSSSKMLEIAKEKLKETNVKLVRSNVLNELPFADKSFDISITSFVAHGLKPEEREVLYREMSRITKKTIIIYDYNEKRSLLTNIIEWLEGGDYFNFIKNARIEMQEYFNDLYVLDMGDHASCYVIKV